MGVDGMGGLFSSTFAVTVIAKVEEKSETTKINDWV